MDPELLTLDLAVQQGYNRLAGDLMGTRASDVQWWGGATCTKSFCYVPRKDTDKERNLK